MFPARIERPFLRAGVLAICVLAALLGTVANAAQPRVAQVAAELSPIAEKVAPGDAWKLAETYAATRPGMDVLVGSGDSMLPLYPSRTVLVVQAMNMADLRRGMTVVFIGDSGRPVAHTLLEKTARGWIAMGVGNPEPDRQPVQFRNYIGTVVKAYVPSTDVPPLAITETTGPKIAAMTP